MSSQWVEIGSPKGSRTPLSAVKGQRPNPIDDRAVKIIPNMLGFITKVVDSGYPRQVRERRSYATFVSSFGIKMVRVVGFEPTISSTRNLRNSQVILHSEISAGGFLDDQLSAETSVKNNPSLNPA